MTDENDVASERYPAVLVDGHLLHVFERDGEWEVWLNTEASEFDGLCIGVGATRDQAIRQAVAALEACAAELQGPPPDVVRELAEAIPDHVKTTKGGLVRP